MGRTQSITAGLVTAIESTWKAIQKNHPDVPEVVVTIGAGSGAGNLIFGHFATNRWITDTDTDSGTDARTIHELFVSGEGLERGAAATLGTLLHEAAHSAANVRHIQDTSRQGRYHNAKFKTIGEQFGLSFEHSQALGWSTTTVPEATAKKYAAQVARLDAAITAHRRAEYNLTITGTTGGQGGDGDGDGQGDKPGKPKNGYSAACECGRKIRVSASTYQQGPIICGKCDTPFTSPDADTDDPGDEDDAEG